MLSCRYSIASTSENLRTLCDVIRDKSCNRVVLFATVETDPSSESDINLPLVAAVAEYSLPIVKSIFFVFDGEFLTAARYPRFSEVQDLKDIAQESGKVLYCESRVPLTAGMEASQAAEVLLSAGPVLPFSAESRPKYFKLLSWLSEEQYEESARFHD